MSNLLSFINILRKQIKAFNTNFTIEFIYAKNNF